MKYLPLALSIAVLAYFMVAYYGEWRKCEEVGGSPIYEHSIKPSCWSEDGRRLFP